MMISCRTFTGLVTAARENKLSAWQRLGFRFHHAICPGCRSYERGFDATVAILHEAPDEPPPEEMRAALLEKLRAKRSG
jgi:hypothetical protein